jgi:LAO/AO transport system kinase
VGVGQDEVDVIGLADVTVLVLVPGMGDEIQSLKAGVMEVADIFVVNKSDRGGAELVEQEIVAMQGLVADCAEWVPPVVRTVATTGEGVGELMETVRRCAGEVGKRRVRSRFLHPLEQKRSMGTPIRAMPALGAKNAPKMGRPAAVPGMAGGGLRLDHLGVAVKSIEAARGFYEALGLVVSHEETVEHEKVKTAMLPLGESRIELLEATEEDSTIGRFLAKRGEGLHHIAVHVEGIDAMFARLTAQGVRLASDAVRVGAGGHRYFFVHPASTSGVLLEIVGDAAGSSAGSSRAREGGD